MGAKPHYIDVDLKKKTQFELPRVTQSDTDTVFILRVTDDGRADANVLEAFSTVTLTSERRDREAFYTPGTKIPGTNEVRFNLGTKELELVGKVTASAQFYSADGRKSSAHFYYEVDKDLTGEYVPTETEVTLIETVLVDGPARIAETIAATADAIEATAFADNTRLLTEAERLATESVRLATEESKDAADEATATANTSAENADLMATAAEQAAALAEQEADDARVQKEEIADIISNGPVVSVNGKTGIVQGLVEQNALLEVNRQLNEQDAALSGRIDNLLGEPPAEGEITDLRFSPVTNITHPNAQARVTDTELRLQDLTEYTERGLYYDEAEGEYINLDKFWNTLRNGKKYTVEFNQFTVSPSPIGTKKDANAGLIAEPSTNVLRGRNDYENIGLFMAIDVNGYVDENDDYHVTAMKGDKNFKADGTNGDVWVMAMPGYIKRTANANAWSISYSDVLHPGYELLDEAVKPDGSVRPYLLHAKYIAGRGKDGKLASISGVPAEYAGMSHNDQITKFKDKGAQYSGKTSHDDFYASMMFYLKYATTHSQSIMQGAQSYYSQYTPSLFEENVKRFILTNAQAAVLVLGSTVSIGDFGTGTINADRQVAQNYNLAERVKITKIEPLPDGVNTAIHVDAKALFTTKATSTITTYPWNSGGCDDVLGTDGSPWNNQSGKEPFIVNGIEIMVGGYEIIQNLIINNNNTDPANYKIEVYANYDCRTYATSPTAAYDLIGRQLVQTNNVWSYLTEIAIDPLHPSLMIPTKAVGSSTTGFADGVYTNTPISGYREWLSFGVLSTGTLVGLRYLDVSAGLTRSGWGFLGRLSATGRSRRRAVG